MANKNIQQFKAIILLTIYLVCGVFVPLFHHHSNKVELSKASVCEKSIYFTGLEKEKKCDHQSHFVEDEGVCQKCNHNKLNSLIYSILPVYEFFPQNSIKYLEPSFPYCRQLILSFTNKGPPNSTHIFI